VPVLAATLVFLALALAGLSAFFRGGSATSFSLAVMLAAACAAGLMMLVPASTDAGRDMTWRVFVVAAAVFTATGFFFTRTVGPTSGDEAHYLLMARSLSEKHTLDVRSYLEAEEGVERIARRGVHYYHITPLSRDGHYYSWHAPGLSFLLAPAYPLGWLALHAVLGLIAGLGSAGAYRLCRLAGAANSGALTVVALFSGSLLWCVYSSRALPEVLGATLMLWFICILARWPAGGWRAATAAALIIAFLPWVHSRFIPLAAALAGLFGLRMISTKPVNVKALAVYVLVGLAGAALFAACQFRRFEGGLPMPGGLLLYHPAGSLWAIFGRRGIVASLPLFLWMFLAHVLWLARPGEKFLPLALALMVVANQVFATTTPFEGGAALPGRFMLSASPLLLPGCALLWPGLKPAARFALLWTGFLSIAWLLLVLLNLPDLGRGFARPADALGQVLELHGGLVQPFVVHADAAPAVKSAEMVCAAIGVAAAFLLLACRRRPGHDTRS
jgi:hypothetical protein